MLTFFFLILIWYKHEYKYIHIYVCLRIIPLKKPLIKFTYKYRITQITTQYCKRTKWNILTRGEIFVNLFLLRKILRFLFTKQKKHEKEKLGSVILVPVCLLGMKSDCVTFYSCSSFEKKETVHVQYLFMDTIIIIVCT